MAESTEILTALAGGVIPFLFWGIKRLANKRKVESEQAKSDAEKEKVEAETDHLESTTMQNFVKALGELQEMNHKQLLENAEAVKENIRQADEFAKQARAMAKLKSQYEDTVRRHEQLIRKSELLSETIQNLEKIVVEEQINKQRLRKIIAKLVGQLEERNIKPDISEDELKLL